MQITTSQVRRSTSQLRSCDASTELCTPGPVGSCTPGGNITCDTVTTGPTLVTSCADDPASAANNWTATTCATTTTGPSPAGSLHARAAASPANSYTTTTCNTVPTGPTPVATCTAAGAERGQCLYDDDVRDDPDGADAHRRLRGVRPPTPATRTRHDLRDHSNRSGRRVVVHAGGGVGGQRVHHDHVYSEQHDQRAGGVVHRRPRRTRANGWTTTTCTPNNTVDAPMASCTNSAATALNAWTQTICTPVNNPNVPVATCTPSAANAGNGWTTTTCRSTTRR